MARAHRHGVTPSVFTAPKVPCAHCPSVLLHQPWDQRSFYCPHVFPFPVSHSWNRTTCGLFRSASPPVARAYGPSMSLRDATAPFFLVLGNVPPSGRAQSVCPPAAGRLGASGRGRLRVSCCGRRGQVCVWTRAVTSSGERQGARLSAHAVGLRPVLRDPPAAPTRRLRVRPRQWCECLWPLVLPRVRVSAPGVWPF